MISYTVVRSLRAKQMRISISPLGKVIVTIPQHLSDVTAETFVQEKASWIQKHLTKIAKRATLEYILPARSSSAYTSHKREALVYTQKKLAKWNAFYQFTWNKVTIKNTSSRWGSCSRKRNLSFSYRILFLPEHLADYLIVHELCHLAEMNHGTAFWKHVEKTIPDYRSSRKLLRNII